MTDPADTELACRELVELVTEYVEGALPAAERRRFELHLSDCPGCVAYVEQLRRTIAVARLLGRRVDAPSPGTRAALLAVFRRSRPRRNGAGM